MAPWTGVALALGEPGGDGLASAHSTYLHPLAGRPLAWHTLRALASQRPAPERILLVAGPELPPELFGDLPVAVQWIDRADPALADRLRGELEEAPPLLAVDAAAPLLDRDALPSPAGGDGPLVLADADGAVAAAALPLARLLGALGEGRDALSSAAGPIPDHRRRADAGAGRVVRDRAGLARAGRDLRDRIVTGMLRGGVSFLLPETVWIDVDVRIGRDCLVYPNVVLEGQTTIGEETVVGPGCRLVDAWIGRGVELKGFNYISHTTVRNRAILEPYVRRGYD